MKTRMRNRYRTWLCAALMLPAVAVAQYERPGSSDAQFLKIGVSARGAGMGDAFIALVDGAEAAYYNPAALAWIPGSAVSFTHTSWFAGINHDFVAAARTFGRSGTFALSATALYTDEMKVRTPLQPDGTGETFYAGNYRVGLSYARYLTDRVTFGGTLNYIRMSLYSDFVGQALAADIAVLYVTHFRNFRFGMKIANFGSEVKFVHESYPLPTNFTFGLAINAIDTEAQTLALSFSAMKPNDGRPLGEVGGEWCLQNLLLLRGGYRLNHDVARYSFGTGLLVEVGGVRFRMDYAYSDFSLLGAAHRIGVNAQF